MTAQFECVNCGRFFNTNKLPKCPVCSASGPMSSEESNLNESQALRNYAKLEDEKTPLGVYLVRFVIVVLILIFIIAFLHDLVTGQLPGGGNVPGKECFDYEKPNGDWANSCDQ